MICVHARLDLSLQLVYTDQQGIKPSTQIMCLSFVCSYGKKYKPFRGPAWDAELRCSKDATVSKAVDSTSQPLQAQRIEWKYTDMDYWYGFLVPEADQKTWDSAGTLV